MPKAIAHAFNSGKLALMEYYRLRNIQADTDMRSAIAKAGMTATARRRATRGDNVVVQASRVRKRREPGVCPTNRVFLMIPSSGILLAAIDPNLIELVLILTALIMGLARLMGRQPPVRPPGQQPPARAHAAGRGERDRRVLRVEAQRRTNPQAAQPRPLAGQPAAAGPIRPQPHRRGRSSRPSRSGPVGGRTAHQRRGVRAREDVPRLRKVRVSAGELGQEVVQTVNREIDQHLRQVFDHSVSRLAAEPGEAAAAGGRTVRRVTGCRPGRVVRRAVSHHRDGFCGPALSATSCAGRSCSTRMFRRPEERWR